MDNFGRGSGARFRQAPPGRFFPGDDGFPTAIRVEHQWIKISRVWAGGGRDGEGRADGRGDVVQLAFDFPTRAVPLHKDKMRRTATDLVSTSPRADSENPYSAESPDDGWTRIRCAAPPRDIIPALGSYGSIDKRYQILATVLNVTLERQTRHGVAG